MAIHSLSASAACGGPMLNAVILPPCLSLSCSAISRAYLSKGLTMLGTPSRINVLVIGSIFTSVVSGTCLTHTTISIIILTPGYVTIKCFVARISATSDSLTFTLHEIKVIIIRGGMALPQSVKYPLQPFTIPPPDNKYLNF
jgi:hypothetical protein